MRAERAFTLMEMVVVLAMMSALSVAALSTFSLVSRQLIRARETTRLDGRSGLVAGYLRNRLHTIGGDQLPLSAAIRVIDDNTVELLEAVIAGRADSGFVARRWPFVIASSTETQLRLAAPDGVCALGDGSPRLALIKDDRVALVRLVARGAACSFTVRSLAFGGAEESALGFDGGVAVPVRQWKLTRSADGVLRETANGVVVGDIAHDIVAVEFAVAADDDGDGRVRETASGVGDEWHGNAAGESVFVSDAATIRGLAVTAVVSRRFVDGSLHGVVTPRGRRFEDGRLLAIAHARTRGAGAPP